MQGNYTPLANSADPNTPAAKGLRAALNRRKASASPAPAAIAPSAPKAPIKPKAEWSPEIAASPAAKAETQRAVAVMRSPQFEQHRDLAMQLFRNPKLSGGEIVALLALAGSSSEAEADAALADMKSALAAAAAQHGSTATPVSNTASAIWARAIGNVKAEMAGEVAQ